MLRPGVHLRWYHRSAHVCAIFDDSCSTMFLYLPFWMEKSFVLLVRRARFFDLSPFRGADVALSQHLGVWNVVLRNKWFCYVLPFQAVSIRIFAGQQTLFHPRGRRGTFWTLLKRWQAAGVERNERWYWRSFFRAGTGFGELGRRFQRVDRQSRIVKPSSNLFWDMTMIPCGRGGFRFLEAQYIL